MNARFESLITEAINYLKTTVNLSFSLNGAHRYINDSFTGLDTETFYALQVVNESTVTYVNLQGGDNASALTLPAGDVIYGRFPANEISVASGGLVRGYILPK